MIASPEKVEIWRKTGDTDMQEAVALIDSLKQHLEWARKGDNRRPQHDPDCVLCVAEPTVKQFRNQNGGRV